MYLRHQAYTLYYRDVCNLVFFDVFAYSMLLRCMLKFKRLACGSDDVTQYNICNHQVKLTKRTMRASYKFIRQSKAPSCTSLTVTGCRQHRVVCL